MLPLHIKGASHSVSMDRGRCVQPGHHKRMEARKPYDTSSYEKPGQIPVRFNLVRRQGFEPWTLGLRVPCSGQLS